MKASNKNTFVHGKASDFSKTSGYFIGRFMGEKGYPELETDEVEISWKLLSPDIVNNPTHFHKVGVEINIVVQGSYTVLVGGKEVVLAKGDFLVVYPETSLKCVVVEENTQVIVVKSPSVASDKFDL